MWSACATSRPARVEQRGRAVPALLDVGRERRADQDRAHVLGDGQQAVGEHLHLDRVGDAVLRSCGSILRIRLPHVSTSRVWPGRIMVVELISLTMAGPANATPTGSPRADRPGLDASRGGGRRRSAGSPSSRAVERCAARDLRLRRLFDLADRLQPADTNSTGRCADRVAVFLDVRLVEALDDLCEVVGAEPVAIDLDLEVLAAVARVEDAAEAALRRRHGLAVEPGVALRLHRVEQRRALRCQLSCRGIGEVAAHVVRS